MALRAVGVVQGILLARLLAPSARGELFLFQAAASLIGLVVTLGLDQRIVRGAARNEMPTTRSAMAAWFVVVVPAAAFSSVVVVLVFGSSWTWQMRCVFPAFVFLLSAGHMLMALDQGRLRFARRGAIHALQPLGASALLLAALVVSGQASSEYCVLALLVGAGIALLMRLLLGRRDLAELRPDFSDVGGPMRASFGPWLTVLATALLQRTDVVVGGLFVSDSELGLYGVAFAIAFGAFGLSESLSRVALASAHRSEASSLDGSAADRFSEWVIVASGIAAMIASPFATTLLFGAEYAGAGRAAIVLTGAWTVHGVWHHRETIQRGTGSAAPSAISAVIGVIAASLAVLIMTLIVSDASATQLATCSLVGMVVAFLALEPLRKGHLRRA